ncbi:hypothetical protein [Vibrio scophthalmi]|uniref:Uncharacterized protein n=1 Tax=Vibrio scophthalmi LMG 19158 TaxID=870967 RepID=F9RP54_9VIBR|nr:hypothetical protein [Vibrio scophthalmi]EGU35970.1 hypothetical protein VIS19158_11089 [Vibrio scophthalmi LMG 19158]
MPSFTFDPKTGSTKLAEGVSISSISIKNVGDVKSYEIVEDNGVVIHKVEFIKGSGFTARYEGGSVSLSATECFTNIADDPDSENAVIFTLSPNNKGV